MCVCDVDYTRSVSDHYPLRGEFKLPVEKNLSWVWPKTLTIRQCDHCADQVGLFRFFFCGLDFGCAEVAFWDLW